MFSKQSSGNAPAPLKLCLCGSLFKSQAAQDQLSTYCNECLIIMSAQAEGGRVPGSSFHGVPISRDLERARSWSMSQHHRQPDLTLEPLAQAPESSQAWSQCSSANSVTSSSSSGSYRSQNYPSFTQLANYSASNFGTPSDDTRHIALPQLSMSMDVDTPVSQAVPSGLVAGHYEFPAQMDVSALRQVASPSIVKASKERRTKDASIRVRCPLAGCGATFTREPNLTHHLNAHYNVRPFACRLAGCMSTFVRPYDRTRHEERCSFREPEHDTSPVQ